MDIIAKYMTRDSSAQFIFVDATETVSQALARTGALPSAGIHLGQALLSCYLVHELSAKSDLHRTKLQWNVDGPFGNIYVDVNEKRQGRGVIDYPQMFTGQLKESLGEGTLQVMREQKITQTGIVDAKGDVCMDLLEYLHQSEQRRCAMNLWVAYDTESEDLRIKSAIGYFFEVFPNADEMRTELIAHFWEEKLAELGSLSQWGINLDDPVASMAQISLEKTGVKTSQIPIEFGCNCTVERAERVLAFANEHDKENQQDSAEISCEFCGQVYNVSSPQPKS